MSEKPLNFAVVGCGMLAQSTHLPNIVRSERMALTVCCDNRPEQLEHCQRTFRPARLTDDFHAAVAGPDVDVVCIATTERLRLPIIQAAAEAGKAVYCEKPMAATLEEMYQIRDVVESSGIPFCVGHNRRSSPAMIEAHRIFRGHMTDPKPCPWRYDREGDARPALAGDGVAAMSVRINDDWYSWKAHGFAEDSRHCGPMLFEMTHFTDLCNWFLAAEPAEVVALEHGLLIHGIIIRYATGEVATLMMCANGTFGYPKELYEMFGNGGAVIVDHMLEIRTAGIADAPARQTFDLIDDRYPDVGPEGGMIGFVAKMRRACEEAGDNADNALVVPGGVDKGHAHALERFVDEIHGTGPMVCGVADAVQATRVAFAALRAAAEKRVVSMTEI